MLTVFQQVKSMVSRECLLREHLFSPPRPPLPPSIITFVLSQLTVKLQFDNHSISQSFNAIKYRRGVPNNCVFPSTIYYSILSTVVRKSSSNDQYTLFYWRLLLVQYTVYIAWQCKGYCCRLLGKNNILLKHRFYV